MNINGIIASCAVSIMAIVISIVCGWESIPSENATNDSCATVEQLLARRVQSQEKGAGSSLSIR